MGLGRAGGSVTLGEGSETLCAEASNGWRALGKRFRNWGRWGTEDALGTLNFITPECRRAAAELVRSGEVFDLSLPLDANGPQRGRRRFNPIHRMLCLPGEEVRSGGMTMADDMIIMPLQCATHWDALAHVAYDGLLYNGVPTSAVTASHGARLNSIDRVVDRVTGRGVLLDIAALRGVAMLEPGEEISADDLAAAERRQGLEVRSGDILLIRTGWQRTLLEGDAETYMGAEAPGLGLSCCAWLFEREVAAVAADTRVLEVTPSPDPTVSYPVHLVLIRDMGMTVGEMFELEALASACAEQDVWEFFLCAPPLKVTGAVGAPTTPLAVT